MKIRRLGVRNYRGIRELSLDFDDLVVFIGENASGKSTILDALRFLQVGVERGFASAVAARGGMAHSAWRGEEPRPIELALSLIEESREYEWTVGLEPRGHHFTVKERVRVDAGVPPVMESDGGRGWWQPLDGHRVEIEQSATACALAAASADASFPGRGIADFVRHWRLFDLDSRLMRRDSPVSDPSGLDHYGSTLAKALYALRHSEPETFEQVVAATRSVLGIPQTIEPREESGRFYFVQEEPGVRSSVHQSGSSSGTLRLLALMAAFHASPKTGLIGIEEPENSLHPSALESLMERVLGAAGSVQFLLTTHSPLVLDFLGRPEAVAVVRRDGAGGVTAERERTPDGVERALRESGFGLGEYYETKGFGAA